MSRPKRRAARRRRRERRQTTPECRLVWAASLPPPPPDLNAGPEACRHAWGESETVSLSSGRRDEIKGCSTCRGFAHRCKDVGHTTLSIRDGAASIRCLRGFPSRG